MANLQERGHLLTEQVNTNSQNLDQLDALAIVELFNLEDQKTISAIAQAKHELAEAIDKTAERLRQGGRLFYVGAGTSGRLGVLDAAECPPTFCSPPELVQGIIAGGASALVKSSEEKEDSSSDGAAIMTENNISNLDVVVGISAGGTTPYVHGALNAAKQKGALTVMMACVPVEQVPADVDINIRLLTGPEILAGSTRLKAGTATKLALNIISTGTMVKLGKTYGNRMVDVAVTNSKLRDRAIRILADLTGLTRDLAGDLLDRSGKWVKLALLMHWTGIDKAQGEQLLQQYQGNLRAATESIAGKRNQ